MKDPIALDIEKSSATVPDSSEDNCHEPEQSESVKSEATSGNASGICNGEVTDSKQIDIEDNDITSSNGSATPVKTGKIKGML